MNWLKPMLLMIVLGGILYGVYTVLNKGPANEPTNAGGHEWSKPPDIQIGVVDDGTGGPPSMPANPDSPGASGQATLPRVVSPSPNDAAATAPGGGGDAAGRQTSGPADIAPPNDVVRGDPTNPASGFAPGATLA